MQRNVLLGVGAVVLVVAGALVLRGVTRHEAGQAVDQNIDQLLANLPPGTTVKHGTTDYNPLTGTLTVHDLAVMQANGISWGAAVVSVSGADARALQDVFDPAAYPNGHPAWTDRRLLIGEVTAEGVHAAMPGASPTEMTISNVSLHRLSGRPFALPPTPQNRMAPGFGADAARAFAFEREEMHDVAVLGQAPSYKAGVGGIRMAGYDGGHLTTLAMQDMAAEGPTTQTPSKVRGTLASLEVDGGDMRGLLPGSGAAAGFLYNTLDAGRLAVQFAAGPVITLQTVHGGLDAPGTGKRDGNAAFTGLTFGLGKTPIPPASAPVLAAFGMSAITTDITATTKTLPGGQYKLHEDLALHDLGTLHLEAVASGYTTPPAGAGQQERVAALLATTLNQASLVWDDASLTDRIFRAVAAQGHTTPELVRGQLAMPIVAMSVMVPDQPDAANQLTAFINHPHRLSLTMTPTPAVTFGQVAAAPVTQRAHLLGLRVTAN